MSVPKKLELRGAVVTGPIQPTSSPFPSGQSVASLNLDQTPTADTGIHSRAISSPSSFVDLLTNHGITKVKFIYMRVTAGTLEVRMTTSAGTDQLFDLSDLFVLSNPIAGSEVTAIAVQGSANIEFQFSGD